MADLPGSALQHTVSRQDPAPGWGSKWLLTLRLIASLALWGPTSCSALPCSWMDHTGLGDILGFCSPSPASGLSVPAVHCTI